VEQELIKLEQDWSAANVKADFAFVDRILADDYVNTDFEGVVKNRGQYIEDLNLNLGKELVISSMVTDDMKAYVYGQAAVVIGRNRVKGTYQGTDFSVQYRWTDSWVKLAGRWQ
jgi:ketosteroid isomerase-like protein